MTIPSFKLIFVTTSTILVNLEEPFSRKISTNIILSQMVIYQHHGQNLSKMEFFTKFGENPWGGFRDT